MAIPVIGSVSTSTQISANDAGDAKSPERDRENFAGVIGMVVVGIFGGAVFYLFTLGGMLVYKFDPSHCVTSAGCADLGTFVTGSLDPFLKECATTLGTIFGSTLGFVFGYYFKATSSPQPAKS